MQALPSGRTCSILIACLFLIQACYSYRPIRVTRKYYLTDTAVKDRQGRNDSDSGKVPKPAVHRIHITKYFASYRHRKPIAVINNRAVKLAREGKFKEAEILFREVLKESDREAAAFNNLGIVYEVMGFRKKAFTMYSRACIMEPGNRHFKRNFLSFADYRHKYHGRKREK